MSQHMDGDASPPARCNASDTIAYVKMLYDRYHKPVWLTEFSCGSAPEAKQVSLRLTAAIPTAYSCNPYGLQLQPTWMVPTAAVS